MSADGESHSDAPPAFSEPPGNASMPAPPLLPVPPARSPVQLFIERREKFEREFLEVKRVCIFYGALLAPLLVLLGWRLHFDRRSLTPELWCGGLMYAAIGVFAWIWRSELQTKFAWPAATGLRIWGVVALTPILSVLSVAMMILGARAAGLSWTPGENPWQHYGSATFAYVWLAVLPAVFEEIAFRGLLLGKLQRVLSFGQAAWVSAILFGIIHLNIIGLAAFLVPIGLVCAWLTRRTGSLLPAMLVHFLHNAAIVTLTYRSSWLQ